MSIWAFKLPDYFKHYGPFHADNLDAAKAEVRRRLGLPRLPRGVEVWNLQDRPMDRWRVVNEPNSSQHLFAS